MIELKKRSPELCNIERCWPSLFSYYPFCTWSCYLPFRVLCVCGDRYKASLSCSSSPSWTISLLFPPLFFSSVKKYVPTVLPFLSLMRPWAVELPRLGRWRIRKLIQGKWSKSWKYWEYPDPCFSLLEKGVADTGRKKWEDMLWCSVEIGGISVNSGLEREGERKIDTDLCHGYLSIYLSVCSAVYWRMLVSTSPQ